MLFGGYFYHHLKYITPLFSRILPRFCSSLCLYSVGLFSCLLSRFCFLPHFWLSAVRLQWVYLCFPLSFLPRVFWASPEFRETYLSAMCSRAYASQLTLPTTHAWVRGMLSCKCSSPRYSDGIIYIHTHAHMWCIHCVGLLVFLFFWWDQNRGLPHVLGKCFPAYLSTQSR